MLTYFSTNSFMLFMYFEPRFWEKSHSFQQKNRRNAGESIRSILPDLIFLMIVELSCFYPTENRCNTSHTIGSLFISSSEELFCGSSSDVNSVLASCLGICGIVEKHFVMLIIWRKKSSSKQRHLWPCSKRILLLLRYSHLDSL